MLDQEQQQFHWNAFEFQGHAGTAELVSAKIEFKIVAKSDWLRCLEGVRSHAGWPQTVAAILHRFDSDSANLMNSASYKFIQNAATIQPFDMVKKTDLRHDASGSWGTHGFEIELLLPEYLATTKNEQRSVI